MSYSRWTNSCWYTYWLSESSDKPITKEEEMFDICGFYTVSYGEMKKLGLDNVIKMLKIKLKELIVKQQKNPDKIITFSSPIYTDAEWEELKGYMKKFMVDVEEKYMPKRLLNICKNCFNFQRIKLSKDSQKFLKTKNKYQCKIGIKLENNIVWKLKYWNNLAIPDKCPNKNKMIMIKKLKNL